MMSFARRVAVTTLSSALSLNSMARQTQPASSLEGGSITATQPVCAEESKGKPPDGSVGETRMETDLPATKLSSAEIRELRRAANRRLDAEDDAEKEGATSRPAHGLLLHKRSQNEHQIHVTSLTDETFAKLTQPIPAGTIDLVPNQVAVFMPRDRSEKGVIICVVRQGTATCYEVYPDRETRLAIIQEALRRLPKPADKAD